MLYIVTGNNNTFYFARKKTVTIYFKSLGFEEI